MKIIKITESDLKNIVKKVLQEQSNIVATAGVGMQNKENINSKNLKIGDGGNKNPKQIEDVKKLQKRLIDLGFLKTKSMTPTGYFGNLTKTALDRYNGTTPQPQQKQKQKTTPQPEKTKQKSTYKLTPRIDQELNFIKQRGLDDKPFFIFDSEQNLFYLFNKGSVLVDYTQVIDGQQKQQEGSGQIYTHEAWCKASGLEASPNLCTKRGVTQDKCNKLNPDVSVGNKNPVWRNNACSVDPSYGVIITQKSAFLQKGIYSISNLFRNEGYTGKGKNVMRLKDKDGKHITAAVHGIPNIEKRLTASDNLRKKLEKDLSTGRVPEKYLNDVNAIVNANQSFGCVGVPADFIENPQVQSLSKGARLFVMGEGKDFLVQNSSEYFDKLEGTGQSCVNPESLAARMSTMA